MRNVLNLNNNVFKNLLIFLVVLIQFSCMVYSETPDATLDQIDQGNYPSVKDRRLAQALDCLVNTDGEWARKAIAGSNASGKPIEVLFKDLSTISPEFTYHDALGWRKDNGDLLIFVSHLHKNAPVEALASLLSHESIHQDQKNSINEETYGWTYEAEVWMQLKSKYPYLKDIAPGEYALVDRENTMEMLFRKAGFTTKLIEQKVRANNSYKSLPETSPGFGN